MKASFLKFVLNNNVNFAYAGLRCDFRFLYFELKIFI